MVLLLGLEINIKEQKFLLYTRGNGKIGEEITFLIKKQIINININFEKIKNIFHNHICLRGELVIKSNIYAKYKKKFVNERTFVISLIRNKNILNKYKKILDIIFFSLINKKNNIHNQLQELLLIKKIGLIPILSKIYNIEDDLLLIWKKWKRNYNYLLDGIVIKSNNNVINKKIGVNKKYPKYYLAYKPDNNPICIGRVDKNIMSVGRTGLINFIVWLKNKVIIKNRKIQKILSKNCYEKDSNIEIELCNNLIPKIKKGKIIQMKKYCYYCNFKLKIWKKQFFCVNNSCYKKNISLLSFFFKKNGISISKIFLNKIFKKNNFLKIEKWTNINGITNNFVKKFKQNMNLLLKKHKIKNLIIDLIKLSSYSLDIQYFNTIFLENILYNFI